MRRPTLILIFITVFLDVLGFGLLIPVAPKFIAKVMGLKELGDESQASLAVGALMATYAAMQFIFAPILGSLSDKVGRRPVILFSLLGSGIDYFIAAFSPNLTVLFITRAINGLTGATIPTCSAYIADITPPEKRAAGFGIIGAAFGLGFVVGPMAGGILGQYGVHVPYIAAGTVTLLNWLYGCFVLPESLPREHRSAFSWRKANPFSSLHWISTHRIVAALAASFFIFNLGQFGLHSTWNLSMSFRFKWEPIHVGTSLCIVGVTAAIVQGGLARRLIPALGERLCLVGGIVIAFFSLVGYGLASHGWMIYAIIALAALGGLAGPAAQGIMSKAISPSEQGRLQGGLAGLNSIAQVLGPLIATLSFRIFTSPNPPFHLPQRGGGVPFLIGAVLALVCLLPIFAVWGRMPRTVREAPDESDPAPQPGTM